MSRLDATTAATRIVKEAGSVHQLLSWTPADVARVANLTPNRAYALTAPAELGRRSIEQANQAPIMNRADLVAKYLEPIAAGLDVEKFWVLCLSRKNRLLRLAEATSGTATAALASQGSIQNRYTRIRQFDHRSAQSSERRSRPQLTRRHSHAAAPRGRQSDRRRATRPRHYRTCCPRSAGPRFLLLSLGRNDELTSPRPLHAALAADRRPQSQPARPMRQTPAPAGAVDEGLEPSHPDFLIRTEHQRLHVIRVLITTFRVRIPVQLPILLQQRVDPAV